MSYEGFIGALLDSCRADYTGLGAGTAERVLRAVKTALDNAVAPNDPVGVDQLAFPGLRATIALCSQRAAGGVQLRFHRRRNRPGGASVEPGRPKELGTEYANSPNIVERVDLVGSYLLRTLARPCLNVDLAVTMPRACLVPKDYLNHRYTAKRALYLGVISAAVLQSFGCCDNKGGVVSRAGDGTSERHATKLGIAASIAAFRGDLSKPVLVLHMTSTEQASAGAHDFTVRIFPCIATDTFAPSKLLHVRNNVRVRFPCRADDHSAEGVPPRQQPPTPRYTNTILEDMCFSRHLRVLHSTARSCARFSDGCVLLKVWLRRRFGMAGESRDTFNGFLLSMVLAHLIQIKRNVNAQMSALQLFRGVLQFLAETNLISEPQARHGLSIFLLLFFSVKKTHAVPSSFF